MAKTAIRLLMLAISLVFARQNAVIMMLCTNNDLHKLEAMIPNFEKRFNAQFKYPYVFLNEEEFTDEFKKTVSRLTDNRAEFGKIEPADWYMPSWIDKERAHPNWERMAKMHIPYANNESYHNMCRYFSRGFYNHPLLSKYEYYWRIEPHVEYRCDVTEDPFDFMKNNNKKYGFVISIKEFMVTIEGLMSTIAEWLRKKKVEKTGAPLPNIDPKERLSFMFNQGEYNGCHFWSNFEIASLEFFRSDIYREFIDTLEESGGFYYERWGDAPIHSIAAALFLPKSQVHFFNNIGYTHPPFTHCPSSGGVNCDCDASKSVDRQGLSCLPQYEDMMSDVL